MRWFAFGLVLGLIMVSSFYRRVYRPLRLFGQGPVRDSLLLARLRGGRLV